MSRGGLTRAECGSERTRWRDRVTAGARAALVPARLAESWLCRVRPLGQLTQLAVPGCHLHNGGDAKSTVFGVTMRGSSGGERSYRGRFGPNPKGKEGACCLKPGVATTRLRCAGAVLHASTRSCDSPPAIQCPPTGRRGNQNPERAARAGTLPQAPTRNQRTNLLSGRVSVLPRLSPPWAWSLESAQWKTGHS